MQSPRDGEPIRLTLPSPAPMKAGTIVTIVVGGMRRRYVVLASQSNSDSSVSAQVLLWPTFKTAPDGSFSQRSFDRLRAWRLARAKQRGVPAYVIATDSTLASIAATRPTTLGELARIKGVGPRFIVTEGRGLLDWLSGEPRATADVTPGTYTAPRPQNADEPSLSGAMRLLNTVGRPMPTDQPQPTEEAIWAFVDTLPSRMAKIVSMRFGRYGSLMTLDEVGREFGVSRERIRQILAKAFRRLAHPSRWKLLWPRLVAGKETHRGADPPAAVPEVAVEAQSTTSDPGTGQVGVPPEEISLADLGLSRRAYNPLRRANKRTVADLLELPDRDLRGLRNFGRVCLVELDDRLAAAGFTRRDAGASSRLTQTPEGGGRPKRPEQSLSGSKGEPDIGSQPRNDSGPDRRSRQPATLTIALRPGMAQDGEGGRLEQAIHSTLAACQIAMSPTQLAHILLGSSGPGTTEFLGTFDFPAFGSFRGSPFDLLRGDILKVAEARRTEFVVRISGQVARARSDSRSIRASLAAEPERS
jgi:hypothetical protein